MNFRKFNVYCVGLFMLVISPSLAFCNGWGGYDVGAKASGLGCAFTGLADDPSALFFNPSGITQLEGTQLSVGLFLPYIEGTFKSNGTSAAPGDSAGNETDLDSELLIIPNFYLTSKISDNLSVGLAQYTNMGIGFKWPDTNDGRLAPGGRKGEIQAHTLTPVIAFKWNDKLSLAMGTSAHRACLTLSNDNLLYDTSVTPPVFLGEANSEISGSDYGYSWNASMLYEFSNELQFGINYRSPTKYVFDDLDVKFSPEALATAVGLANTKARMDITLPQYVSLGTAWSRGPLTLTCDIYWWDWSVANELRFHFEDEVAGELVQITPLDWKDTFTYAIGAEYKIKALNRDISLRGGFMYDTSPVRDATVNPAGYQNDNLLYDIGLGTQIGPVYCDFFLKYIYTKDRSWDNANGDVLGGYAGRVTGEFTDYNTYSGGFNVTYKF